MGEQFNTEEETAIAPFVSNINKPIFVLRNLPEVIKGALFSRYSRSTKGLRRLLLDEFILGNESGFRHLAKSAGTPSEELDVKRAQDFYDRILDGYGDDSIGELGGAHVAFEQVSIIATKILQDPRIGGSPLEKSTRYVYFDQKVDGDYQFYKDPRIMESRHADAYLETNRLLFSTYSELIEPMTAFLKERYPREENVPESAYKFTLRAKACDALRALLPASTLTNMGIFGNGRFYENLLIRLQTHELTEMHTIADNLRTELDKTIPSFVRRSYPEHKHFPPFKDFITQTRDQVRAMSEKLAAGTNPRAVKDCQLISYDTDAEDKVIATILYPYIDLSMQQIKDIVSLMSLEQRESIIADYCGMRTNRRHKPGRAFENATYMFDLTADYGAFRDLHRHRIMTQERQELGVRHGHITPPEIIDAGFEEQFKECMRIAAQCHHEIKRTHPREASYVVPLGYRIQWYVTLNLRQLYWMCELRSVPQGHTNYRRVVQEMYRQVKSVHPRLVKHMNYIDMNDYSLGRLDAEVKQEKKKMALQHQ